MCRCGKISAITNLTKFSINSPSLFTITQLFRYAPFQWSPIDNVGFLSFILISHFLFFCNLFQNSYPLSYLFCLPSSLLYYSYFLYLYLYRYISIISILYSSSHSSCSSAPEFVLFFVSLSHFFLSFVLFWF